NVTITATAAITNTTCTGSTGALVITVSGGTAPYTYLWSNAATTKDISGLAAGPYTVTITDANGCKADVPFIVGTTNATITVTPSVTNTSCTGSTGAIAITVSGGTSPYTYAWTGPAGYTSTNKDITGLAAGSYSVKVTDANGCSIDQPATV